MMSNQETLLAFYLREFKISATFESVNAGNLFLDHEAAAKALGLPPERLEHLQQAGLIECAYFYNPLAGVNDMAAAKMYLVSVLKEWFIANRNYIAPMPTVLKYGAWQEDSRIIKWKK